MMTAMPKLDHRLQKWIRWLDIIQVEITRLVVAKHIFWSVQEMIKQNKEIQKPSEFYRYLGDTYIAFAVMGVRRQIKNDPNSVSTARLLSEIGEEPRHISRKYYRSLYVSSGNEHYADKHFDRYCHNPNDPHVSAMMAQNDLAELKKAAETCEDFADKRVAHYDKRAPKILPKFKELDDAIEALHRLYLKYRLVLLAECWTTLLPTYQYDWKEIFDCRWRLPEEEAA
jgi:hypothetical protein